MQKIRLTNKEVELLLKESQIKRDINTLFAHGKYGNEDIKLHHDNALLWQGIIDKLEKEG